MVGHAQDLGSYAQGQGYSHVRGQIVFLNKLLKQIWWNFTERLSIMRRCVVLKI